LWAEWLREELLAPVAHRHVVLTVPRLLRPLFRRRRELLVELARAAAEASVELLRRATGEDLRSGLVVSLATAGDLLQWHPHLHILATDGGFAAGGTFVGPAQWDATLLMSLFRQRLLARLLDRHAISQQLVKKLLAWRHPGFSAHVGEPIPPEDKKRLEDTAAYLVRNPLSLKKLGYLDGHKGRPVPLPHEPVAGEKLRGPRPSRVARPHERPHPRPGTAPTILYGHYANRTRGARRRDESEWPQTSAEPPRRRSSPTWARLIAKIYQADPLICTRCGQKMKMIAFLTDRVSIRRMLDHLGLSPQEQAKPPPVRELLRVAEQGEGWGVPANWAE
jgi:hypothetical protein